MNAPKISVIVPVYNVEKWLHRCVDSILAQTFTDFELLLIDDGSTDASGAICDEYAQRDSRIRVFHKPNGGVSSARNLGLDNAQGEWITFCDSDDYVGLNWLENFGLLCNDQVDIICQGIICMYQGNNTRISEYDELVKFEGNLADLASSLVKKNILGYCFIKAFRLDILSSDYLSNIRFNTKLDFMEDEDFTCRYLMRCKNGIVRTGAEYTYVLSAGDKYSMCSFDRIPLYKYFIELSRKLYGYKGGVVEKKYHHLITASMLITCKKLQFKCSILRQFRSYVLEEFRCCPLFCITKVIIALDFSGIISSLVLRIHTKIKGI